MPPRKPTPGTITALEHDVVDALTSHLIIDDPRPGMRHPHRELTDAEAAQVWVTIAEHLERHGFTGPAERADIVANRHALFAAVNR